MSRRSTRTPANNNLSAFRHLHTIICLSEVDRRSTESLAHNNQSIIGEHWAQWAAEAHSWIFFADPVPHRIKWNRYRYWIQIRINLTWICNTAARWGYVVEPRGSQGGISSGYLGPDGVGGGGISLLAPGDHNTGVVHVNPAQAGATRPLTTPQTREHPSLQYTGTMCCWSQCCESGSAGSVSFLPRSGSVTKF